jgi:hypothetical protein
MEFILTYKGPLKGNSSTVQHKQNLRRNFHKQLKMLWSQEPLSSSQVLIPNQENSIEATKLQIGNFTFVPLITQRLYLFSELDVLFLRPGPRGSIIYIGGDIDNRLKTLLDSLRAPKSVQELPRDDKSSADESPFFCLLEDDALVTSVSVSADQYLESCAPEDPLVIIKVRIKKTRSTWNNSDF